MKKEYISPQIEAVKLELLQMIAVSGPGAGDQKDPDKSRFMDDIYFDDDDW